MKDNPGLEKRALQKTPLRGFKDPLRAILPRREGSRSLKHRGSNSRRDRLQARSLRQGLDRRMKDDRGPEKRVLQKTSLSRKAFRPRSNLPSSMGTLFALPTLKLGG
jgi:hypothetical protein